MARPVDMLKKIEELRETLRKYNGIPSQKEDRAAHANLKYYIKHHREMPEIQALIEEFDLDTPKSTRSMSYDDRLAKINSILSERGCMPSSTEENTLYNHVRDFFKSYKDRPEVERVMYLYAFSKCYPLPHTKYTRPNTNWELVGEADSSWFEWRMNVAYEFCEYVFQRYGVLPAPNTKPYVLIKEKINYFYRNSDMHSEEKDALYSFVSKMVGLGCKESIIVDTLNCFRFCNEDVQAKVRRMLIRDGACAVKFIAQKAIPGIELPDRFVFNYYYVQLNDSDNFWDIGPLGNLYRHGTYSEEILLVHYKDANRCNVNAIRMHAQENYRDWTKMPPETESEWRAYGQWFFFVHKKEQIPNSYDYKTNTDWSTTVVDDAIAHGRPYFRYYRESKYLDYILFLLENGHSIDKEEFKKTINMINLELNSEKANEYRLRVKALMESKGLITQYI
jgi:hypothetical protein